MNGILVGYEQFLGYLLEIDPICIEYEWGIYGEWG